MTHNDILRRVRYILDARDNKIVSIFAKADHVVTDEQVNRWLKRDDDPAYLELSADELLLFLDGLIIDQRGPKDGPKVKYVQPMSNNLILMKLKIALNLKSEDVLDMMKLAGFKISKHELSALFRKRDHKHYRVCKNQILRKFLKGVQIKYRGQNTNHPKATNPVSKTNPKPSPSKEQSPQQNKSPNAAIWKKSLNKKTD